MKQATIERLVQKHSLCKQLMEDTKLTKVSIRIDDFLEIIDELNRLHVAAYRENFPIIAEAWKKFNEEQP